MYLIVTGSRVLWDAPRAQEWSHDLVRRELGALPLGSVVVTGDARGPDASAQRLARQFDWECLVYGLDGYARTTVPRGYSTKPAVLWHPDPLAGMRRHGHSRWPLLRNEEMVRRTAREIDEGATVRVLALHAPWSRTSGTGHTAGLARRAGLVVVEHTAPAELGPQGGGR
jgi:hypothetical protein